MLVWSSHSSRLHDGVELPAVDKLQLAAGGVVSLVRVRGVGGAAAAGERSMLAVLRAAVAPPALRVLAGVALAAAAVPALALAALVTSCACVRLSCVVVVVVGAGGGLGLAEDL